MPAERTKKTALAVNEIIKLPMFSTLTRSFFHFLILQGKEVALHPLQQLHQLMKLQYRLKKLTESELNWV